MYTNNCIQQLNNSIQYRYLYSLLFGLSHELLNLPGSLVLTPLRV